MNENIVCEYVTILNNGNIIVKTYSKSKFILKQVETGILYSEALDIGEIYLDDYGKTKYRPKYYSYEETDTPIENEENNGNVNVENV